MTLLLSLGFIITASQQIANANRSAIPFSSLFRATGALPWRYLVTLLFPNFFGNPTLGFAFTPRPQPPQPYNNFNELCIYAGIPVLLLVSAGWVEFGAIATCAYSQRRRSRSCSLPPVPSFTIRWPNSCLG